MGVLVGAYASRDHTDDATTAGVVSFVMVALIGVSWITYILCHL